LYIDRTRELSLLAALICLLAGLGIGAPAFFTIGNANDILLNTSTLAIASLGMTMVMLVSQIDVSVGAMLAICSTIAGYAAKAEVPLAEILVLALATGAILGLLNGALTVAFRVHSIVITLGTLSIYRGALLFWTGGAWLYDLPRSFLRVGQGLAFGIPIPVLVMVAVFLLGAVALRWTPWGRSLFAVGSNAAAARLSGLNVPFVQISAFMANGVLIGLAALLQSSRFNVIQSNTGIGFEFSVITAVIVGGTSTIGGSASVLGTLLGALFVTGASTAVIFFHLSGQWVQGVEGGLLLVAVSLDAVRWHLRRRMVLQTGAGR
jgi:ribose/xylose/arabinose/galactoside ABC-type transport system permease subunit